MKINEINETENIENNLGSLFNPIAPQEGFIQELQDRLRKKAQVVIERPDYLLIVLLVFSGLAFGIFIYWMIKMFIRLFGSSNN